MSEDHWLWRLDASAWLAAAQRELDLARMQQGRRTVVAHLRRSAGMALNAVMVADAARRGVEDDAGLLPWGRSYVEHLQAVGNGRSLGPLCASTSALARQVLAVPMAAPSLVPLAGGRNADLQAATEATRSLLASCIEVVETK